MNRRGFLASLAALAAAPFMPVVRRSTEFIRARFITRSVILNEAWMAAAERGYGYVAFVHPSIAQELWEMSGRGRWEVAWRRYRVARREGVCGYLPPNAILERFTEAPALTVPRGALGGYEGMRILERAA